MAKNWTSALYEHSKKPLKPRKNKVELVECYCGKLLRPNLQGIARCYDCKMHVDVNLFNF